MKISKVERCTHWVAGVCWGIYLVQVIHIREHGKLNAMSMVAKF